MNGWQWCHKARGRCARCRRDVTGVWKFWKNQTTAMLTVCADCAGGEGVTT